MAIAAVVAAASGRGQWLPVHDGTLILLLFAASLTTSAPHLWAMAARRERQPTLTWASALAGALDIIFGLAAATIAITNQRSHWIGGSIWTIALAAVALLWLLSAPGNLVRTRR